MNLCTNFLLPTKSGCAKREPGSRPSGKLGKIGGKRGFVWGAKEKYFVSKRN